VERNTERFAPHDGSTRYLTQLKCSQSKSDWRKVLKFVSSIIAGNRAFILNREWYDVTWAQTGCHGNEATWEVCRLPSELFDLSMRITATRVSCRALNRSQRSESVTANLVYLQDQSYKFRVRPGGREWTGYGPPVMSSVCSVGPADSLSREAPTSAVQLARSHTTKQTEKVHTCQHSFVKR
jgi:hypothetical protein